MKTLREQVADATTTVFGSHCTEAWTLGYQLQALSRYYFQHQTPECVSTRAVRRALELLDVFPYGIAKDEPGVE